MVLDAFKLKRERTSSDGAHGGARRASLHFELAVEGLDRPLEAFMLSLSRGELAGHGLRLVEDGADHVVAVRGASSAADVPERIQLGHRPGEPLAVAIWCRRMKGAKLLRGAYVGGVVGTVTALAFGWLIPISVPVAVVSAWAAYLLAWRRAERLLVDRFRACAENLRYLARRDSAAPPGAPHL